MTSGRNVEQCFLFGRFRGTCLLIGLRTSCAGTALLTATSPSTALEVSSQIGIRLLRAGEIAVLQGAGQAVVITVRLLVRAEGFIARILGLARKIVFKCGQGILSARSIARAQRIADGIEIVHELDEGALIRGLIGVGRSRDGGDATHKTNCDSVHFQAVFTVRPFIYRIEFAAALGDAAGWQPEVN